MNIIEIFPKLYRSVYRFTYSINPRIISQKNVFCPCCSWSGKQFLPFGNPKRTNVQCPRCKSVERHRLYYLFLKEYLNKLLNKSIQVLHISPEKSLKKLFCSYPNIKYLSIDISPFKAMRRENVESLSFSNHSFDLIFCSHVLEHIKNDQKALTEIKRVLKPNGLAIIQVPIKDYFRGKKIIQTIEETEPLNPKQREINFGQADHQRLYGRDFYQRLIKSGFKIKIIKFANKLPKSTLKEQVLLPKVKNCSSTEGWINLCYNRNND
ncbi:MAG: hypothetical protein UR93_C0022G0001 [Berkelbacteria bacterium GW2011_GWA2_35_9]|uniref:Methyltransferase type 11 domain-containing protein n=1 Tax=Berkelbacteria bacterium GW2011_GWA2_35_9 TaxID=1618333 RepID=A0A0G0DH40_9BACT|nr:MAG: hypothetical protein UR93_C0022G0001 [Berkelbacteria bacterium GW2011_GWA2_35_9]